MRLYDTLTQNTLNSIIYKMLNNISLKINLNLFGSLDNDYINLSVNWNNNIIAGDEVIVNEDFIINCNNLVFNHLGYALKLYYYYLPVDINNSKDGEVLKELIVPLTSGDNVVHFENYPVYLQGDFELLINKSNIVDLPAGIKIKLNANLNEVEYPNEVVLTAILTDNGEPISDAVLTLFDGANEIESMTTDEEGVAEFTLSSLSVGNHIFHIIYDGYSSRNIKITSTLKTSLTNVEIIDRATFMGRRVTGYLEDELGVKLKSKTISITTTDSQGITKSMSGLTNNDGKFDIIANHNYPISVAVVTFEGDEFYKSSTITVGG